MLLEDERGECDILGVQTPTIETQSSGVIPADSAVSQQVAADGEHVPQHQHLVLVHMSGTPHC